MRLRSIAHPARRRAAAAVAFAVVVPLLLMFLLGIVEYGRLLMAAQITTYGGLKAGMLAWLARTASPEVRTWPS